MDCHLRAIELKDLSVIRQWRNHSKINRFMFFQHKILENEHKKWFEASRENPLKLLYVYEENRVLTGFLQLQKKSMECQVYEWGFYIDPSALRGTGSRMAKIALYKIFNELGGDKVFGEVLSFNYPPIKLHQKLGFSQEGLLRKHHFLNQQYYDVRCFGMLRIEWELLSKNIF